MPEGYAPSGLCHIELQALLEKAGLNDGDSILAVGDIVDRGPETPQVLNFFQHMPNARALMGNHERKHVRAARHEIKLSISQQISRQQLGDAYAEAVAWMGTLPLYNERAEAIIVHGYLEPVSRFLSKIHPWCVAQWGATKSCVNATSGPGMSTITAINR